MMNSASSPSPDADSPRNAPDAAAPNDAPEVSSALRPENRGRIVAFEGIDGAGKTTQARLAAEWLRSLGRGVLSIHEPTDGPIGRRIRELARAGRENFTPEQEFRFFLDDRRWNVETNIQPALAREEVVVLDRYYISSIAYQGALGLDPVRIRAENEAIAPAPDRIYLLDLPASKAEHRIRAGRGDSPNLFERTEYLERVAVIFNALAMPGLMRIDATLPVETIQDIVQRDLATLLG